MTHKFKKVNDFDRKKFFQDFERNMIGKDQEFYEIPNLNEGVDNDLISPSELWFMVGYIGDSKSDNKVKVYV
ncbi:hypothetical protein HOK51_06985 [Candidatus Woesearchaeota archaeon]|jgi:hypothetical protein|nr:hypothetical protein [Candidatus Woesearchaeota archaeon]MBT6519567.1 hypothetical protein [Candidatus Woesearchaeota archaeon]MBT7367688.1 hypothetical protein [Candidatus Woesearchaeota archaeon]